MIVTTCLNVLILIACTEPADSSELLPKTPPDWRYERINFPLPFAPDLKHEGFEELRFAPGMFNAKSDTYFTYVFAMKITNDVSIDAKFLKTFLEIYFRGLCRTVAKGSSFDIDPSKILATVSENHYEAPHIRHFQIVLSSFDPFVTGKPLKLNLEMLVVETQPNDHRIFAAVSPKPVDSTVWKLLRKLKQRFQERATRSGK